MIWDKKIKKRVIGIQGEILSEKLMILMGGIHGNEPKGVEAIRAVFQYINENTILVDGCILGLKGNIEALENKVRYIDRDLNRLWSSDQIEHIRRSKDNHYLYHEEKEQSEILYLLNQFLSHRASSDAFLFLDLHTTSAENGIFIITNEHPYALAEVSRLEVPVVRGLHQVLPHTTLDMFSQQSFAAIAFEAGQHDDPNVVQRMQFFILLALHDLGIISLSQYERNRFHDYLKNEVAGFPRNSIFYYKHSISEEDEFRMKEGFKNFDKVTKDQILAYDKNGAVFANADGYILMPLYQKIGQEGFYIIIDHN